MTKHTSLRRYKMNYIHRFFLLRSSWNLIYHIRFLYLARRYFPRRFGKQEVIQPERTTSRVNVLIGNKITLLGGRRRPACRLSSMRLLSAAMLYHDRGQRSARLASRQAPWQASKTRRFRFRMIRSTSLQRILGRIERVIERSRKENEYPLRF